MAQFCRQVANRVLPPGYIDKLRQLRRVYRRLRFYFMQVIRPTAITEEQIVGALFKLGIKQGDKLMVHSSLSRFGKILGGPSAVIGAIDAVVGGEGLVAMPAFPMSGKMRDHLERGEVFDVRKTPSRMGAITEYFRKMPDVCRSLHPTHSVCAKGKNSKELVAGHEKLNTPFSYDSPFDRLVRMNATLVLFGVDFGPVTAYHVFEDRLGDKFPLNVYLGKVFEAHCVDERGFDIIVKTRAHDPALSNVRIDNNSRKAAQFYDLFKRRGLIREINLGKGKIISIGLESLLLSMQEFLSMGITIYEKEIQLGENAK